MIKHNLIKVARRGDLFKLLTLSAFCCILIFIQKQFNYPSLARDYIHSWMEPIRSIPHNFVNWYYGLDETLSYSKRELQNRIDHLEKQNALLSIKVHQLSLVKQQNVELSALLDTKSSISDFVVKLAEVRFIANGLSPYEISINLDADDGLKVGQAVVSDKGVVGQISHVGLVNSRVLLLNSPAMSISVYNKRNGLRAIAHGASVGMILNAPDTGLNILPNDIFLATGLGGVFPTGYPVGKIIKTQSDRYMIRSRMQNIVPTQSLRRILVLIPKK